MKFLITIFTLCYVFVGCLGKKLHCPVPYTLNNEVSLWKHFLNAISPLTFKSFFLKVLPEDFEPCLALEGLTCSGFPLLPIKQEEIYELQPSKEGPSRQDIIVVAQKQTQTIAARLCTSLCMQLIVPSEEDFDRMNEFIGMIYTFNLSEYSDTRYHTGLQIDPLMRSVSSLHNNISFSMQDTAVVYSHFKGNTFGSQISPLAFSTEGNDEWNVEQTGKHDSHFFICSEKRNDGIDIGPKHLTYQDLGYFTDFDIEIPTNIEKLETFMNGIMVSYFDHPRVNASILMFPQFMTVAEGLAKCHSEGGILFEPKNDVDFRLLDNIIKVFKVREIWLGIATDSHIPRQKDDWKYMSTNEAIRDNVFNMIQSDDGDHFIGHKFCKRRRGEFYAAYVLENVIYDRRGENLAAVLCQVEPLGLPAHDLFGSDSRCLTCKSIIGAILSDIFSNEFIDLSKDLCGKIVQFVFGVEGQQTCEELSECVSHLLEFTKRYIPITTCRWATMCTQEEAQHDAFDMLTADDLSCNECISVIDVLTFKVAMFLKPFEEELCFASYNFFGSKGACQILKHDENAFTRIVQRVTNYFGVRNLCKQC